MNRDIKHSEEFKDIISKFPKKYNAILTFALFGIIIIALLFGWFIQSPEVILADVKVTAEKPPIVLIAESSGKLKIKGFVSQKFMKKNEPIAIIENPSNEDHVYELKDSLAKYKTSIYKIPISSFDYAMNYNLGEVQNTYFNFINTLYQIENNKDRSEFDRQKRLLNQKAIKYNEIIEHRIKLKNIKQDEIKLLKQKVYEDSVLYSKGIIIKPEYDQSQRVLIKELENLKLYESQDISNQLNITDALGEANLLSLRKELTISDLQIQLLNSFQKLILAISEWEKKYLIKAPIDGQVDYLSFLHSNQFVKLGEALFSILPDENKIIGQALLPTQGAGKVKEGQEVYIKLNAFPYQEFGKLSGRVKNISLIPNESLYLVTVELSKGLKSDSDKNLSFGKNMSGQAEIITSKRRLIYKVFDKIQHAFNKEKRKDKEADEEKVNK